MNYVKITFSIANTYLESTLYMLYKISLHKNSESMNAINSIKQALCLAGLPNGKLKK